SPDRLTPRAAGTLGRGYPGPRPREASRRVPAGRTAVHRHGSAEPADDREDVPPKPSATPGPRPGRLVAPDGAGFGHANELYRDGAAPKGREHDRKLPAREQPLQQYAGPTRRGRPPGRGADNPADTHCPGRDPDHGGRHREPDPGW